MPSPETGSPLAAIRDKERALAQAIRTAQEKAAEHVALARARADAIKEQAERDGLQAAEALYQNGMAKARAEADGIRAAGEEQAAHLQEASRARVPAAADYIVEFVLPHSDTPEEPDSPTADG